VANDAAATVTEADVRGLAARLKGLHGVLRPAEQALLQAVLRRAAGRDLETPAEGVAWAVRFNPFPYLDAVAAEERRAASAPMPDGGPD
jgi:hypothetical protein